MRRSRAFRICLALAATATLARAGQDPFADCERLPSAETEGWARPKCFVTRVRDDPTLAGPAIARLEARLDEKPDPWTRFYLGNLSLSVAPDIEHAAELYRAAAAEFADRREGVWELFSRHNLTEALTRLGRLGEAETQLGLTERLAEELDREGGRVALLRANLLSRRGDLRAAYVLLHQLADEATDDPSPLRRWDLWKKLGNVCQRLGRYHEALAHYRRLAAEAAAAGEPRWEASARLNLLSVEVRTPSPDVRGRLLDDVREVEVLAVAAGRPAIEAQAHLALGKLLGGDEGLAHLERCLELLRHTDDARRRGACLRGLAEHLAEDEPERALAYLEEAVDLALESEDPWAIVHTWPELMRVSWAARPADEALAISRLALDAFELLRLMPDAEDDRATLFAAWVEAYTWLSGRLLTATSEGRGDELEGAFAVVEQMRARVLLEALDRAGAGDAGGDWDPLLERISEGLAGHLRRQGTDDEPVASSGETFATLEDVAGSLGDGEALLSFQVGLWEDVTGRFAGGSWLVVVTRDATRLYKLPDRLELEPRIAVFRGLFERRDGAEAGLAAGLYGLLLADALADLPPGIEHLVVVPDGDLHLLPFGALRESPEAPPIAVRYRLVEVPSATLWWRWRRDQPEAALAPALVLADPAPGVSSDSRQALGALPHARDEAKAIRRHLGRGTRLLVGGEASEGSVKGGDLGSYAVLHFAAHAVVDDREPQRSAIYLASGDGAEDGLLGPGEIADLDLGGRLVVLSACRSASGTVLGGEGVLSLARAFFEAGAHAVVGSLWPLRDADAAAFFDVFYRHLGDGESVAAALTGAQRELIEGSAPAEAWAGIVALGDGSLVPFPGGRRGHGMTVGILFTALAAILAVFLEMLRRRRGSF